MSAPETGKILEKDSEVAEWLARACDAEFFAVDLEFVSESRYIPELALIQIGFPTADSVEVAAIDPLSASIEPVLTALADPQICKIAHAAKQDLSLLGYRHELVAQGLLDTQFASAFLGMGEQIGYGKMVSQTVGVTLDKGAQWTDWLARPLSDRQLSYALDDVRYLCKAWPMLRERLQKLNRLDWVVEESDGLCELASQRKDPDEVYLNIGGGNSLKGESRGALRELAAWRERQAVEENTPPSWIFSDSVLVELARRKVSKERDLKKVKGVGAGTTTKYGDKILDAIALGITAPLSGKTAPKTQLESRDQVYAFLILGLVHARALDIGLPPRFLASRSDVEELVLGCAEDKQDDSGNLKLLKGWRGEAVGNDALAFLKGQNSMSTTSKKNGGIQLDPPPSTTAYSSNYQ